MAETSNQETSLRPAEPRPTPEQTAILRHVKDFIRHDNQIKEALKTAAYPVGDELGAGQSSYYRQQLTSSTETIDQLFTDLSQDMSSLKLNGQIVSRQSRSLLQTILETTLSPQEPDMNSLERVYRLHVSNMRPDFIQDISRNIHGYSLYRNLYFTNLAEKSTSFNELLHLCHSTFIADDTIFKKLPQWAALDIPSRWIDYHAYGQPTEIGQEIFSQLKQNATNFLNHPHSSKIKEIPDLLHLFSIDQTIHLMVRDFGHALTIEIDTSNPHEIFVAYQIPKIFDGTKINQLPGVRKVTVTGKDLDFGTSGSFVCPSSDIGKTIVNFIQQVPTDTNH